MNDGGAWVEPYAKECGCGSHHPITVERIVIEAKALDEAAAYLAEKRARKAGIVADQHTYDAAGAALAARLRHAGIETASCLIRPDERGDVLADEKAIVQVLLEIPNDADVLLAVGSGTIHDIVRFAAYKTGRPFVSIPTAPSVDGFASMGAPLIIRGFKTTVPAVSPIAIFADLDVLSRAPQALIAAGFGDMIGKYTSLFDWEFSRRIGGEPYCEAAARMTRDALQSCAGNAGPIGRGDLRGVEALMRSLVLSGLAMLLFAASHPASGAEHHLSHRWEMDLISGGKKQILHGLKVGAACAIIAGLYKDFVRSGKLENAAAAIGEHDPAIAARLAEHGDEIRKAVAAIPEPDDIRAALVAAGGAATPEQLGIERESVERSLREAHLIRSRHTLLWLINTCIAEPS